MDWTTGVDNELVYLEKITFTVMVINYVPFSLLSLIPQHSWCHLVPLRLQELRNRCCLWVVFAVAANRAVKYSIQINLETRRLKMGTKMEEQGLEEEERARGRGVFPIRTHTSPDRYPNTGLEIAVTWDCYQTLQLALKVHNVFA